MNKSKVILVGGFLGAGKTSMLWKAAEVIKKRGMNVGLITNDQATNLVDTTVLEGDENLVREVSGSCFCCNFPGYMEAVQYMTEKTNGGVIIAEPVGSCTDLSATIVQPMKDLYAEQLDTAPLTVMADPQRLETVVNGVGNYIAGKQFEEADVILINKSDLLSAEALADLKAKAEAKFPEAKVMTASVKAGIGIEEWLDYVMQASTAGTHLAEVDYDIYADGEAAYGWLNADFALGGEGDYETAAKALLASLGEEFDRCNAVVGHVKFLVSTPKDGQYLANLTGTADTASMRKTHAKTCSANLTVNARVEMGPDELEKIVVNAVEAAFGAIGCSKTALRCLIPGRPNPTYRYDKVI